MAECIFCGLQGLLWELSHLRKSPRVTKIAQIQEMPLNLAIRQAHVPQRTTMEQFPLVLVAVIIVLIWLFNSLNVLREYERGVIFRIGRLLAEPKGPGLIWVFWPIDRIVRGSLRTMHMDVTTHDHITTSHVTMQ